MKKIKIKETKTRKKQVKSDLEKTIQFIRKHHTPKHVVEIELNGQEDSFRNVLGISEDLRIIRNTVLGVLYKSLKQMVRTKKYKQLIIQLKEVNKELTSEKLIIEEKDKLLEKKNLLNLKLENLRVIFNLTFEYAKSYGTYLRETKYKKPDAVLVLSICENVWDSIEKVLYGKAKKPRFLKKGEYVSLQGKQAERCVILKTDKKTNETYVSFNKMKFSLRIKKTDLFIHETMSLIANYIQNGAMLDFENAKLFEAKQPIKHTYRVCNNRIVIKEIRGKVRFYVQITLEGLPVVKRNKDGSFRHKLGTGKIGNDIGTQSIASVGDGFVSLKNLAERSKKSTFKHEQEIVRIQRYLSRSQKAMNPENYNENGTIKKGKKEWKKSKRYKKEQKKLKNLHRKAACSRKYAIQEEVNALRALGDCFIIEQMNIAGLQKKAKEVTVNQKTGKFNKRKRFGKSILKRCPGTFISKLKYKCKVTGGSVHEVNNWTFKASQYDHKLNDTNKKTLSKRWHEFEDGTKVQRDLYSAFLLFCANIDYQTPNQEQCLKQFESFLKNHNKHIEFIKENKLYILNSGIKVS